MLNLKHKKVIWFIIIVMIVLICIITKIINIKEKVKLEGNDTVAFNVESITDTEESIKQDLEKAYPLKNGHDSNVYINKTMDIGSKELVVYTRLDDNWIGLQQYRKEDKNMIGRERGGIIKDFFSTSVFTTEGKKYLCIGGINEDKKISYMEVTLDGKDSKYDISNEDAFIKFVELSDDFKANADVIYDNIKFYDYEENDIKKIITKQYFKDKAN